MKSLLADNHRDLILSQLPAPGLMLEWGSGGTTEWLLERLKPDQRLLTVEHAAGWASEVRSICSTYPNWVLEVCEGALEVGANATHWEECPAGLADYICRPEVAEADVILIDGVARGACLAWACANAKTDAVIYLHDMQDVRAGWYDWSLRLPRINHWRVVKHDGTYPAMLAEIRLR